MRGDQTSRQWKLVQLLSGQRGRTLAQLTAELGVAKRTVQRDIDVLERGGFPVISEERNGTVFWRFMDGFRAESMVSLGLHELMSLYYSRGLLEPLRSTAIYDGLRSALSKIGAAIPAQGHAFLRTVEEGIAVSHFGRKDFSRAREVLAALTKAVYHHFTVEMFHAAAAKQTAIKRRVDPYKLWYANAGLYLVAWDHDRNQYLVFAVERIRSVKLTNRRFEVRADFDFEKLHESAFNMIWGEPKKVRVRFSAAQAHYVKERTWHASQKITENDDGSVILEMSVGDLGEVRRWLIGWGADAEVLEPGELALEIAAICRVIADRSIDSAVAVTAKN